MRLPVDANSPIPGRPPLTEQLQHVIEGGVRRAQAMPSSRELAGFLDRNTVTRAIEELKGSGCRPLHSRPEASASSAIQGAPAPQRVPRETAMESEVMRGVINAVKEDGS
jgi:DNA-binding transcriptional regulator YhcF (GntR family)